MRKASLPVYGFYCFQDLMKGKEVVIRTLDIGADKQADYFGLPQEQNPAMGCRAIRLCLTKPEIFRTQLRALYRASVYGKLLIMFPMITSVKEVDECKRIAGEVRVELSGRGIAFDPNVPLGIMIETPAAAIISGDLAEETDFFSIGTNDLTQYTLAVDRQNALLGAAAAPVLVVYIKETESTICRFCLFWCGRRDLNPYTEVLAPKTNASAVPPRPHIRSRISDQPDFDPATFWTSCFFYNLL